MISHALNAEAQISQIVALTIAEEAKNAANAEFLLKANACFGDHGIHSAPELHI